MKYKDMPKVDQLSRRVREMGAQVLSNAELLAVALRINDDEAAREVARLYNEAGGINFIQRHKLTEIKGVSDAYADSVAAIAELVRREAKINRPERIRINSPKDAADLLEAEMSCLEQEQLRVILMDTRNQVLKIVTLYQGTLNSAQVRVAEVMREAICENAAGFILVHNHPSSDPTPSTEDVSLTRSMNHAAKLMDVDFLDHLIIGYHKWTSLKERGMGFS